MNTVTQIDKRQTACCACGCKTVATVPHFRFVFAHRTGHRFAVLPQHEERFRERESATRQLCDLVGARHGFIGRQLRVATLYRLHKTIGTSRRAAIRATILYALPVALRPVIGPFLR